MASKIPLLVLLLLPSFAVPAAANDWEGCVPVYDARAVYVTGGYYVLSYSMGTNRYTETWQETNGIGGLQTSSAHACGGTADTLMSRTCAGRFCVMQGY